MSRAKRLILFERGSKAAEIVFRKPGIYVCPICGDPFDRQAAEAGDLTLEHVPPESLGGRAIALTCRGCNSTAGHTVDAAMHRRDIVNESARFIVSRQPGELHRIILTIGEKDINVQVSRDASGTTTFRVIADSNDPSAVARVREHMDRLSALETADGEEFGVRSRVSYHPRMAKVGDLRSAFLAAFAALGYRYALSAPLEPVRDQLRRPEEEIIPPKWTVKVDSVEVPMIALGKSSEWLLVHTRTASVLLPWITSSREFYAEIASSHCKTEPVSFHGHLIEWPSTLRMALDLME